MVFAGGLPAIAETRQGRTREIHWGRNRSADPDSQHGCGYAPAGEKRSTHSFECQARESTNMISAINNQGKVWFQIYDGMMNADRLIDSCAVERDARRKVILILDNQGSPCQGGESLAGGEPEKIYFTCCRGSNPS